MEMEYDSNRFASKGTGAAGLTTGIIGTALGVLNGTGGLLGGVRNGGCCNGVTQYEATMLNELAAKDARIALLEANTYNDQKLLEVYKYFDGELKEVRGQLCQQAVINSQITANISCMQNSINVLNGLTKTVIPVDSICPEVMQRYNSWVAPTASTTT